MKAPFTLVLCVLLLAGCDLIVPSKIDSGMVTLHLSTETVEKEQPMSVTISNSTTKTLTLAACGGRIVILIEELTDSGWESYGFINNPCLAIFDMSPVQFQPDASKSEYFRIYDEGTYRLSITPQNDRRTFYSSEFKITG